jgi:hypothetical protein
MVLLSRKKSTAEDFSCIMRRSLQRCPASVTPRDLTFARSTVYAILDSEQDNSPGGAVLLLTRQELQKHGRQSRLRRGVHSSRLSSSHPSRLEPRTSTVSIVWSES